MADYGTYSPFTDAAGAFNDVGNNINRMAIALARQRYQQGALQQQMMLRARAAAEAERMNQIRAATLRAQGNRYNAAGAIDTERLDAARKFGTGMTNSDPNAALIQAAIIAALSGNPQRASEFQANDQALRSVQPMSPGLGAAILTGTRSAVPVSRGGGVFDTRTGTLDATMPPVPGSTTGTDITPSSAATALTSINASVLPPDIVKVLHAAITNSPTAIRMRGTNQPIGMSAGTNAMSMPRAGGQDQIPTFNTEEEARAMGYKTGDVIRLRGQGVGTLD